jgi:hypothetical protein
MIPERQSVKQGLSRTWDWLAAAFLPAFYLATSVYIASKRLFWNDEIITVQMARLPDVAAIWRALLHGWELLPVSYYVIVRASEGLLGRGELAARLPSALGLAAGMLLTFDCARSLTNRVHGLIAQAILACSFLPYYGSEARPYGLYFMFSALLLWLWLSTSERSKSAACWFGVVVMLATTVHYYVVLCLAPYGFYEIVCRRMPSWKTIAGATGAALALAALSPQILIGFRAGSSGSWWAPPSLARLQDIYQDFFPSGLFLLATIAIGLALIPSREGAAPPAMSAGERLSWCFLLIPVAGYVMAKAVTHSFHNRYFIGALPGIAVGFSCLLCRQFGDVPRISWGMLFLFAGFGMAHQARKAQHPEFIQSFGDYQEQARQTHDWEDATLKEGKKYLAMDRARLIWLPAWYYSKQPERYVVLLEPGEPPWGLLPMEFWTLDDLKRHAPEVAFIDPKSPSLQRMKDAGLQPMVRAADPLPVFYFQAGTIATQEGGSK